ncbi:CBS domain protein [Antricoccus suffuscus]|uniref:CBS domain protein n=1 Tax=Antricoccus suffuscus TaxID=1629062 RepID=A0A2T1A549_9ACTN|nr:CBS domain-containing protein [Antricoccus suffuscus]PRZ43735.1 CBS domain protein [Antricoccus suffuscus]
MNISEILRRKGSDVITVVPATTVRDLIVVMAEHNIGAAVVQGADSRVLGIVSERDVVRRLVDGVGVLDHPVEEIMTADVTVCRTDSSIEQVRAEMTERRIRHLPVIDDGELKGIVSIGDVVKSAIDNLQFERDQLSDYVNR